MTAAEHATEPRETCPAWCVAEHHLGDVDHRSAAVYVAPTPGAPALSLVQHPASSTPAVVLTVDASETDDYTGDTELTDEAARELARLLTDRDELVREVQLAKADR